MRTLIIPDLHERIHALQFLEDHIKAADRVVQLGDWVDSFRDLDQERMEWMCHFINASIDDPKWTCLLGNHDAHYFFKHPNFQCSGYDPRRRDIINSIIKADTISRFKLFTHVGPYLVSHAGFCEATLQYAKWEIEAEAIRVVMDGGWDPIFGAGRARGGRQRWGGPVWLDWNEEFQHIEGVPQIVGHTNGKDVRTKGNHAEFKSRSFSERSNVSEAHMSWCLDASSRWAAWVDGKTGKVTPEELGGYK